MRRLVLELKRVLTNDLTLDRVAARTQRLVVEAPALQRHHLHPRAIQQEHRITGHPPRHDDLAHPKVALVEVHQVAVASGLFIESDIKVRVNPFTSCLVGNKQAPFIHVFTHIMQGRTTEQKAALSKAVVSKLHCMFTHVDNIAMNIDDFEKATYCNKNQL